MPSTERTQLHEGQPASQQDLVPYYVRALALGIPAILLGLQISGWLFFIPVIEHGHFDFRHLYTAGYMVRTGHAGELYDYAVQKRFEDSLISHEPIALPFNHLAYEALLFVPFSFLGYRAAYFAMLAVNTVFLAVAYRLLRPYMENLALAWKWLGVAMFVTFLPNAVALMQGQDSIALLLIFTAAFALLVQDCELSAGLVLGLALFKFQLVLPLALLYVIWRRWRFVAGFGLSALAVSAGSLLLVGISQGKVYFHSLFEMGVGLSSKAEQFRYGILPAAMPNLRGLTYGLLSGRVAGFWLQLIIGLLSFLALALAARAGAEKSSQRQFQIATIATALVSYHFLAHDMSILLVPICTVANEFLLTEQSRGTGKLQFRAMALMFTAPICMSILPGQFYLVCIPLLACCYAVAKNA